MKSHLSVVYPTIARISLGLLMMLCLFGVQAQVLEYEGFDYPDSVLNNQDGGNGWTKGPWSDPDLDTPLSNDGISLAFPVTVTHPAPVGSRIVFTTAGEAMRTLGTSMPLNIESNFYFSALVNRQGAFRFEFRDAAGNARWRIGGTNQDALVGVNGDVLAVGAFPSNETVYIVSKMAAHVPTSPGDRVYVSVYRAGQEVPATEPTTWQATMAANSGVILTNLQILNISSAGLEIDEIRIGTSWADVVGPVIPTNVKITTQPAPVTAYAGLNAIFSVEAAGQAPITYQWYHESTLLLNQTNAVLVLSNVQSAQAGSYYVAVTNAFGGTNSLPALLEVIPLTNVTVGLQAMWHLDETTGLVAADATTNLNNGALVNFLNDDSQWIVSDYNRALAFRGSNYVEVPHSASIGSRLANMFSVATWIRPNVTLNNNANAYRAMEKENTFFLLQGDGNTNNVGNGGMNLLVKKGGANLSVSIGQPLQANQWYHLAGTFDGTTVRIYLDGELKDSRPVAAPIDTSTAPLHIGSDYVATTNGTKYLNGAMDEVGIWDRPLQEGEIRQLAGAAGLPVILEQPQSQTCYEGGTAIFRIRARGQQPIRYQWLKGSTEIRGAVSNVLVLGNVQIADAGNYTCRVSNDLGDPTSDTVTLTVVPVTSINDALEALWHFDEGTGLVAADASTHARDGQLVNYPDPNTQWTSGQVNGALGFDGMTNRVFVPGGSTWNGGLDTTIAFWIHPTAYGTVNNAGTYLQYLGRVLRKGTHLDIETVDDPGSVRATIRVNGIPAPQQNILALNEWQHFTVVFSGGMVRFYKNGFLVGDPVAGNLGPANTNQIVLGYNDSNGTNHFTGSMDEVGIWGRTLSEVEILNLAGRDVSGAPIIVSQPHSATRYVNSSVSFQVEATGQRPLFYQWFHNGNPVGASTNRLVLTNLTLADAGNYTVSISNDLGVVVSSPAAVLTVQEVSGIGTGLIAYWTFDETDGTTFNDASGHGHHAALQGGTAVPGSVGMVGTSYRFDGVNDYAIVPHADELNLDGQATISLWINPATLAGTGDHPRFVRKDINFDFNIDSVRNTFMMYGLNKAWIAAPNQALTNNVWQHIAVVVKDGTIQFFKDGRALAEPIPGLLGPGVTNDLIIGNFGIDLAINRVFNGYMDELGIWDRALSASELDGIYQNGMVGRALNAPFIPFRIESVSCPSPSQVRLTFTTPHTGRAHAVQRRTDLTTGPWVDETDVVFNNLGGGLMEALVNRTADSYVFYQITVLAQGPLFAENFETGAPGWSHGGPGDNWEVGVPVNGPGSAIQGTNVYATSLTGNVNPYSDAWLRSPVLNLTGNRATLTFQQWRNIDPDIVFQWCEVNVLDAATMTPLQQLSKQAGATTGWELRTLPLPPQLLGRNIVLEFRLICDAYNLLEGWYIDDVKILPE